MNRLHQAIEGIQRHQHRIWGIPTSDHCEISIVNDLINHLFKAVSRL